MKKEFKILITLFGTVATLLLFSFYLKDQVTAATCGNGICEGGETCRNCSIDCGVCRATCGNGICEVGENCRNCQIDCGTCGSTCGNGKCESGENPYNCCIDCYLGHFEKRCFDNDVYWYDCFGHRKDKAQECGDSGWSNEYRCFGNWVQRKYLNRGCSNNSCYFSEEWRDYQYCSNYCANGKCVSFIKVITKGAVVTY